MRLSFAAVSPGRRVGLRFLERMRQAGSIAPLAVARGGPGGREDPQDVVILLWVQTGSGPTSTMWTLAAVGAENASSPPSAEVSVHHNSAIIAGLGCENLLRSSGWSR